MSTENTTFAVIRTGGKQYKVTTGQRLEIEKLDGEVGAKVKFPEVLLLTKDNATTVGAPLVAGTTVEATIVRQSRDSKVVIYKKTKRKGYTKKQGHRQYITTVNIDAIV